jgi:fructose-1,6-bisphosphatase/inositol monophosphatase family enzyme
VLSLVDRVSGLLAEVVAEEVMGRFQRLRAADVERKATATDPDDLVTVADREVERSLTALLPALWPGSLVIGEEAVHEDPRRLEALARARPVWLIDPIDGTRNFARGEDAFGVMIALVEDGLTRAAWIDLPARGRRFVAERGAGAFLDGERLRAPAAASPLRGTIYTRYMPPELAAAVARDSAGRYEPLPGPTSAAIEYTAVARGEKDFVVYHRLLPWDHAPGALILSEAGGAVEHADGRPYEPRATSQLTIVGVSPAVCAEIRSWLVPSAPAAAREGGERE